MDTLPSIAMPSSSFNASSNSSNEKYFYHAFDSLIPSSHPVKGMTVVIQLMRHDIYCYY